MNILEQLEKIILYLGGYTVVVIGISTWLGAILAKFLITGQQHQQSKQIEALKKDLDILGHQRKVSISRYDEKKAMALEKLHLGLVDFELFVQDQLGRIISEWLSSFEASQKILNTDQSEKVMNSSPEYAEELKKNLALKSNIAMAKGTLKYIGYGAFSKWSPEIRKIKTLILQNEIYLSESVVSRSIKLVNQTEAILAQSVRKISSIALEANTDSGVHESVGLKITQAHGEIAEECFKLFNTIRKEISSEISVVLEPK